MTFLPAKHYRLPSHGLYQRIENRKHYVFLFISMIAGLHMSLSAHRQTTISKLAEEVASMPSHDSANTSVPLALSKLPTITFGVILESDYFNYGVRLHSITTVPQVVRTHNDIIFSIPHGADENFTRIVQDLSQDVAEKPDFFASRCASVHKDICKTAELLRAMKNRNPTSSWYFIAGHFTLFIPDRVNLLLRTLNSDYPMIIGAPGFSNCSHADVCRYVTHADVTWGNRTYLQTSVAVEAGFTISRSTVAGILRYFDATFFNSAPGNHSQQRNFLSSTLGATIPNLSVISAHSFFSHPTETELYLSGLYDSSRLVSPVSFPFADNIASANGMYENVRSRPQSTDLVGEHLFARPWSNHRCADVLAEMREKIAVLYGEALRNIKEVAIIGIPAHENRGDSAIYVGERHLLDDLNIDVVYETDFLQNFNLSEMMQRFQVQREERLILMHGGGNFGNHYYFHHKLRLQVMQLLPNERIVHFPNSICAKGDSFWAETYQVFSAHKAPVLMVARDWNSTEIFRKHLGNISHVTVVQSPDMAFYMNLDRLDFSRYSTDQVSTIDLLIHARADKENISFDGPNESTGVMSLRNWKANVALREFANSPDSIGDSRLPNTLFSSLSSQTDDWLGSDAYYISSNMTFREKAEARTVDGIMFLRRGKVVFTDRLHSHILLTLIQTPHVALDNIYRKVSAYHDSYLSKCDIGVQRPSLAEGTAALAEILMGKDYNDSVKL